MGFNCIRLVFALDTYYKNPIIRSERLSANPGIKYHNYLNCKLVSGNLKPFNKNFTFLNFIAEPSRHSIDYIAIKVICVETLKSNSNDLRKDQDGFTN